MDAFDTRPLAQPPCGLRMSPLPPAARHTCQARTVLPRRVAASLLALALLLAGTACASNPRQAAEAPPADDVQAPQRDAFGLPNGNGNGANDPWESFNRRMHGFNERVDRYVARPLAVAYTNVTPNPVRRGITNVFTNLFQPISAVHMLLQGKPKQAGSALARFGLNTTLGIGGLMDPATEAGLRLRREDFGQTLATWGWRDSRFLVLPFLGPATLRDAVGDVGDFRYRPFRYIERDETRIFVQGVYLVDLRANALVADGFMRDASDTYTLMRDAYLQRRRFMINDGDDELPDYLFDFEDADDHL